MRQQSRRPAPLAVALTLSAGLAAVTIGGAVGSDSTFLSMSSQPGDYIGQGQQYLYTTADATFGQQSDGSWVRFSAITPGYVHWWYVNLAAPSGQPLVAGTYNGATRFADATHPGLDVYGDGRGCNAVAGTFTVNLATYDASNNVVAFDATFEQHCEGFAPALTGEIAYQAPDVPIPTPTPSPVFTYPPTPSPTTTPLPTPTPTPKPTPTPTPPPTPTPTPTATPSPTPAPLLLGVAVNPNGTVRTSNKVATIGGTVACNRAVTLTVSGTLSEAVNKGTASASFTTQAACTPSGGGTWTVSVASSSSKAFTAGIATAMVTASGVDPVTGVYGSASASTTVSLAATNR